MSDLTSSDASNQTSDPRWLPDPVVAAMAEADAPWPCVAAAAADAKLGTATLILDVGDAIGVTDHFVITNGNNTRQVRAIVNEVEHQVKLVGGPSPRRTEGLESLDWVLIDYGEFVVHVFSADARGYYQLERLWKDCEQVDWRSMVPEQLRLGGAPDASGDDAEADVPADAGDATAGASAADSAADDASGDEASDPVDPVVERATW